MQKTQFSKGIFWRSFVERKTEKTFVLLNDEFTEAFAASFIIHLTMQFSCCCFASANE